MSNGYLVAAQADLGAAHEIGEGFGLDVIDAAIIGDHDAFGAALTRAANVGFLLSSTAARSDAFIALMRRLAARLQSGQIIIVDEEARAAFAFLPNTWPSMTLEEARQRAARRREMEQAQRAGPLPPPPPVASHPAPTQPAPAPAPQSARDLESEQPRSTQEAAEESSAPETEETEETETGETETGETETGETEDTQQEAQEEAQEESPRAEAPAPDPETPSQVDRLGAGAPSGRELDAPAPPSERSAPSELAGEAPSEAPPPTAGESEGEPEAAESAPVEDMERAISLDTDAASGGAAAEAPPAAPGADADWAPRQAKRKSAPPAAPADATAFAPNKLRRGTPELIRIVIHQPDQLRDVIKAARKIDPRTEPAPQGMSIGEVALGSSVGVSLEVRGAACEGGVQRRTWAGAAIDFSFSAEAEMDAKQAVFLARVFVNDAQIGVLAFTRKVAGPAKKPASAGDVRLRRFKRVFLSYSSKDRETVSAIATAYEMAGVEHFWDRTSLKSGEEFSPRIRREIDRADLFHLCWSKSAAQSPWVEQEATHALTRRKRNNGKTPEITLQMLDGPPWAAHPASLASINFDDFVRAAIVGYARGEADA